MKIVSLIFGLLLYQTIFSQSYILIDRQLSWSSYLTDSVNQKISITYFPIFKNDLDTLIKKVELLGDISKLGLNKVFLDETNYSIPNLTFKINSVPGSYGDKYDILLISNIGEHKFTFRLSNPEEDAITNKRTLQNFLNNLRVTHKAISTNKIKIK